MELGHLSEADSR